MNPVQSADYERTLLKGWGQTAALLRVARGLLVHSSAARLLRDEIDAHLRDIGCEGTPTIRPETPQPQYRYTRIRAGTPASRIVAVPEQSDGSEGAGTMEP